MKIKYLFSTLLLFLFFTEFALSQATETTAKFQKGNRPAFTISYNQPDNYVIGAIQQKLKQDGISYKTARGVISCTGVQYPALSSIPIDLYFQVEGKGRKGMDGANVNLFISKGKDNYVNSKNDSELSTNALRYLVNLQQNITVYSFQQQITAQQKLVDGKAKDYRKLLKDSRKLQDKQYGLQKDLSSETDPSKQDKLRGKIQSLDKKIDRNKSDIQNNQHDLMKAKDQLNFLQQQLNQATANGKN